MTEPLFTGINHVGILTRDVDRSIRTWADRYGVGPWYVFTFDGDNMRRIKIKGREVDMAMRVAHCQLSPTVRLELIQPLVDDDLYSASLKRHDDADHLHHIRFEVEDYGAAFKRLGGDLGLETEFDCVLAGANDETCEGVYFAAEADVGFPVEIGLIPPGFSIGEPEDVYPAPEPGAERMTIT